jgi:general stress protein 26
MEIRDYTKRNEKSLSDANHSPFFPKDIFCIVAGSTGCGKTNLMLNLLLNEGLLHYSDVYVYSPTLYQNGYQNLKDYYLFTEERIRKLYGITFKIAHFYNADDEIKDPSELDPKLKHIMIFDDVMLHNQSKIRDYFTRGRHNNVNVFYLCQSLHKIAKHSIRDNANVFILFHQDDKTLKYFYETHISGDMDFREFKSFCDDAWSTRHGFIVINLWEQPYSGRYVANYKTIHIPKKYKK